MGARWWTRSPSSPASRSSATRRPSSSCRRERPGHADACAGALSSLAPRACWRSEFAGAASAPPTIKSMLSPRQEQILCRVVDDYLRTGQPVESRSIAAGAELACGPSTVRNELALLEDYGLLTHPHVSAGRVPTDGALR